MAIGMAQNDIQLKITWMVKLICGFMVETVAVYRIKCGIRNGIGLAKFLFFILLR